VKEGAIDIVSIAEDVPAETKAKVDEIKKGLARWQLRHLERPDRRTTPAKSRSGKGRRGR